VRVVRTRSQHPRDVIVGSPPFYASPTREVTSILAHTPTVLVLHNPRGAASLSDIVCAAAGWCRPHFLFRPVVAEAHPALVHIASLVAHATVLERDDGQAATSCPYDADGLLTFADAEYAQGLLDCWQLPGQGTGPVWDKFVQRDLLFRHGLTAIEARRVEDALTSLGLPLVLKPRRGAGGAGITFVASVRVAKEIAASDRDPSGMLAERLAEAGTPPAGDTTLADFVSVELAVSAGEATCVAVFDKFPVSVCRSTTPETPDVVWVTGVSHATSRCRAIAETVVSSCRSPSTAQSIARVVSLARGAAKSWPSAQVCRGHVASGNRHIRLNHRTRTGRPKHAASCKIWTRRP